MEGCVFICISYLDYELKRLNQLFELRMKEGQRSGLQTSSKGSSAVGVTGPFPSWGGHPRMETSNLVQDPRQITGIP